MHDRGTRNYPYINISIQYPKNQVIVTSRIAGYHDELKGFETLEVMPFNDHQIEQFITWFGKTDAKKAQSIGEAIEDNEKIKELASNPLMIADVEIRNGIVNDLWELYQTEELSPIC